MELKKKQLLYKIVILGGSVVGKSNFISRYVDNTFNPGVLRTIGVNFQIKNVTLNDGKIAKIQIWDSNSFTGGGENMNKTYFKGANGFIIIYNITDIDTFEKATFWLEQVRNYLDNNNIAFVGNYLDKVDISCYDNMRKISTEEGKKFAEENDLLFFETSNITGFNVNECFNTLIFYLLKNV